MTDYESYALRRDADTVAKFVGRMTSHRLKLALYKEGQGNFPKPPSKNSKYPAYEAAGRIVKTLGMDMYVGSVPDMTLVLSRAMEAIL